ncbi:hypothetical protein [Brachybacterium endophyticum]|uniref:hypothetical protein n=1 Tax=Brachybacterium endophyticum TaxID=2182385 RepID=UPI00105761E4|nr:hypothetical protein [Brachybacterium endophyticum]
MRALIAGSRSRDVPVPLDALKRNEQGSDAESADDHHERTQRLSGHRQDDQGDGCYMYHRHDGTFYSGAVSPRPVFAHLAGHLYAWHPERLTIPVVFFVLPLVIVFAIFPGLAVLDIAL